MSYQLTVNLETVCFVDCALADVRYNLICLVMLAGLATVQLTFSTRLAVHHIPMLLSNQLDCSMQAWVQLCMLCH